MRYLITLRALPSSIPPIVRVRRALRYALRACDLRCVDIREIPSPHKQKMPRDNGAENKKHQ